MSEAANLWLYFVVVFGVIVLPGMDMAFVMGSALVGGRRAGFAAVAGIVAGGVCHMLMTAAGIGALLQWLPAAFNLMLLVGAGYMIWIGWALMRSGMVLAPEITGGGRTMVESFRRAVLTSLLNPKAYVFMLAIFPQFVRPGQALWSQAGVLGLITAATQVSVYGGLALLAARARGWLAAKPEANRRLAQGVGLLLMTAAALTAWDGWRRV